MATDKKTVELRIVRAAWCEAAAAQLAGAIRGAPCYSIEDLGAEIERGEAELFRVDDDAGELVGYVVMRIEVYSQGAEGVIVAGGGRLAGVRLYGQVVPALERMFRGVKTYRVESCRRAGAAELEALGYLPTHIVYRKAAPREVLARDDMLEQLVAAGGEACGDGTRGSGGPDLRSRPGKVHGGGGGKSTTQSSSTNTTNNVDRRIVADGGSIAISNDGGAVSLTQTDYGAVERALTLARDTTAGAIELSRSSTAETAGLTRDLFASSLTVLDKAGRLVERQTELVAKAYDAAKGAGTEKTLVAIAAVAAVVVVVVVAVGKK